MSSDKTIYFGYGSNLWLDQMKLRCPLSVHIGVGLLMGWKWIINERGYANIIPSPRDSVYGFLFELTVDDEGYLDIYEGNAYKKEKIPVKSLHWDDLEREAVDALIYVDNERKSESHPRQEYIHRMNLAIADALQEGVPSDYIEKYIRPFIPPLDNQLSNTN